MTQQKPIIIIGTGVAGYTVARELRNLNQDIPLLLITADDGAFYSKPLISNAISQGKTAEKLAMLDSNQMAEQLKAELRIHTVVTAIDAEQQCVYIGDEVLAYDKLVLAWGAQAFRLPIQGNALDDVYSVNSLNDYAAFARALSFKNKKRVAILGAGLIGCEFANDLCKAGFSVDVAAVSKTPLDLLLPANIGTVLQQALSDIGVRWHLDAAVTRVDQGDGHYAIQLADGTILQADVVLSAVGIKAQLQLAAKAGLEVYRGIVVDRYLQTSDKNIYAVGDCAEVEGHLLQYITPIMRCARALVKTLNGEPTAVNYPPMPVIVKTPACPCVILPPPPGTDGCWEIVEQDGVDVKALYHDANNQLQGFILMGKKIPEKMALIKAIPAML